MDYELTNIKKSQKSPRINFLKAKRVNSKAHIATPHKRSRSTLITQTKSPPLDEPYKTSAFPNGREKTLSSHSLNSLYAHIRSKFFFFLSDIWFPAQTLIWILSFLSQSFDFLFLQRWVKRQSRQWFQSQCWRRGRGRKSGHWQRSKISRLRRKRMPKTESWFSIGPSFTQRSMNSKYVLFHEYWLLCFDDTF